MAASRRLTTITSSSISLTPIGRRLATLGLFEVEVNGATVFERLEKAFACPTTDPETGLAQTTEGDRAVGFGFCDGETHTGKLLFASLLRYRAAGELAELASALGHRERVAGYRQIQKTIRANVARTFGDPA